MDGSFHLKKAANGQFYFNLKSGDGEILLTSEMYVAKSSAEAGIVSVQANSPKDERYSKAVASNGKAYFTLRAANHQVIGMSKMYDSEASRDAGVSTAMAIGAATTIKDDA